jgi:hypothetical protein
MAEPATTTSPITTTNGMSTPARAQTQRRSTFGPSHSTSHREMSGDRAGAVSHHRANSAPRQCQFGGFRPAAPIPLHTARMTDNMHDQFPDGDPSRALKPREYWEEHDGEPMIVWDEEAHAAWLEKWAPR